MTAKQAIPGITVLGLKGLECRTTPHIEIGVTKQGALIKDQTLTILEAPRRYLRGTACVKFRIEKDPTEYYCFWSDFKKYIK